MFTWLTGVLTHGHIMKGEEEVKTWGASRHPGDPIAPGSATGGRQGQVLHWAFCLELLWMVATSIRTTK